MSEDAHGFSETRTLVAEDESQTVCALHDLLNEAVPEGVRAAEERLEQRIGEIRDREWSPGVKLQI